MRMNKTMQTFADLLIKSRNKQEQRKKNEATNKLLIDTAYPLPSSVIVLPTDKPEKENDTITKVTEFVTGKTDKMPIIIPKMITPKKKSFADLLIGKKKEVKQPETKRDAL